MMLIEGNGSRSTGLRCFDLFKPYPFLSTYTTHGPFETLENFQSSVRQNISLDFAALLDAVVGKFWPTTPSSSYGVVAGIISHLRASVLTCLHKVLKQRA